MRLYYFTILFISLFNINIDATTEPKTHEYSLPNGLKILVKEDHRAPVATVQVWYKVGSSYEYNGITGISHALEHMMFNGTRKYGKGELHKIIAEHGGEHNAFTAHDFTCYLETLPADKLALVFELEADRMSGLLLDANAFTKEKQVIIEESKLYEDMPKVHFFKHFNAAAYIANPYRHPVIGWMQDIQNLTTLDLKKWYQTWYVPNNATLVIVGDVNPQQVLKLARRYFSHLPNTKLPELKKQAEITPLGKRSIIVKIPAKVPMLLMGYNVPSAKTTATAWHPYALDLVSAILSAGASARLPKDLIRNKQLATYAGAFYDHFARLDTLFALYALPTSKHTTQELEQALLQQIKKLQTTLVDKNELQRVKNQFIAYKVYARDSIEAQGFELGSLVSVGLPWQLTEQYLEKIKAITPQQIKEVAKEYLIEDHLTTAKLQPQAMTTTSQTKKI